MALVDIPEPWNPAQATDRIRNIAREEFTLSWKNHAWDQLYDRDLIMSDLHYLLKNGFVFLDPVEATRKPYWRYAIQTKTPNSKNRDVRAIVIPDWKRKGIKVVTVMWADEPMTSG